MASQREFTTLFIAIACALGVVFTTLFLSIMSFNPAIIARRDFIVYWATGHQLVQHGNPYDPQAVNRIERDAGFRGPGSYYMRNTPWALPLAYLLGYFSPVASALPWSLVMLALLIASVRILWKLFGIAGTHLDWLGYCFPPALFCVILGQTSILMLFGLSVFLRLHKSRPFAAGAALWLCTLKPHLFLPYALVLLIWIFVSRSYRILAGGAAAFAVGAVITSLIDPSAWSQYAYYMRTSVVTREFTPCLGDLLRDRINPSAEWIAFIPAILGCIWALIYFWPRRHAWDWLEHGSPLLLVSLLVAPFRLDLRSIGGSARNSLHRLPQPIANHALSPRAHLRPHRSSDHLALRAALGSLSLDRAGLARLVSLCARLCPHRPHFRSRPSHRSFIMPSGRRGTCTSFKPC